MNSVNSGNIINHRGMNWGQFKDPLSYPCLHSSVASSLSLTQEVDGSKLTFYKMLSMNSLNSVKVTLEKLLMNSYISRCH